MYTRVLHIKQKQYRIEFVQNGRTRHNGHRTKGLRIRFSPRMSEKKKE